MMHSITFMRDSAVGKARAVACSGFGGAILRIGFAALAGLMCLVWGGAEARAQSTANGSVMAAKLGNSGFSAPDITQSGDITVEGWVYGWTFDPWCRLVEMYSRSYLGVNSTDAMAFCFSYNTTRRPFMEIWKGPTQYVLTAPDPIPLNTWTHVAFVVSGNSFTIYVNGTSVATTTSGASPNSTARVVTLGRNFNSGSCLYGYLADVRIWSVARTTAQIQAAMPIGSVTGATTGLVAAWPLGVTGNSYLADVSGNGRSIQELGSLDYNKLGSGTVVMTGANTTANGLNINDGTFQVGDGGTSGSLGSGAISLASASSTLAFNRSDNVTWSQGVTGSGKFVKQGAGLLTISGGVVVAPGGGTVISGGSLLFTTLRSLQGPIRVDSGATLRLGGWDSLGYDSNGPYVPSVTVNGGTVVMEGGPSQNASTSFALNAGKITGTLWTLYSSVAANNLAKVTTLASADSSVIDASTVGFAQQAVTFDVADGAADADLLFSSAASNFGGLLKAGAGRMVLAGANTYSGTTTISAGTLQVGNGGTSGVLGTGAVVNNGVLAFNRSDDLAESRIITGSGALSKLGTGKLTVTGNNTYAGTTTISAGTMQVGNGGTAGALGAGNIVNNAALTYNRSDSVTVAAAISGTGSLTQSGAGTLTVTGDNAYSGTTTVSVGTLQVGNGGTSGALGTGAVVNNGVLAFNRSDDLSLSGVISGSGSLSKLGAGQLTVTGNSTYAGTTTISGGTLQVGNGGTTGALGAGAVVNNGVLGFNRSDSLSVSAVISGTGKVVNSGSGTLTLTGNNTFTGGLDANAGTVKLGTATSTAGYGSVSRASGNTITVSSGAKVVLGGVNLFGNHSTVPANAIVVNNGGVLDATDYTFNTVPTLTLNGGTVSSSGIFQYYSYALRGGVVVNGGANTSTLSAQSVALGSAAQAGATFDVADGSAAVDLLVSGTLLDGPSPSWPTPQASYLTKTGAGTMVLAGANVYSGTTTISAGTLQVGNGGTSGALGTGAVVNNGLLAFNRSDDLTQSTVISGSGALSKSGAGKLTVTGNNTYAGTTTIAGGTLQVGNGGTSGSLGAGGIVNNGALVLNRSDSFSLAGAHSGTGSLLKQGAGKVTMALNSAVQGNMDVTAGTLVLGASGNITSPLIRVSGGAALDASLRSAGLSLGSGQTLMNVGGTAGIAGTLDTTSGQLALSFAPGTPAMSISNGVLILAATTQLRITNNGAALGKGTYRIISKLSGGLVSGTVPAVSIEGGGIISGGLARLSIVSGELVLTVKAVTQLISGVKPPEILFHQGFLVDATGTALGSPNPKNYELAFRMYTAANGGTPVWGERQTVTVDNGRFGVHLGEGDPYQGDPTQDLSSVFIASEGTLYIETTVRGGGVSGADLVLTPRALVPPTAYAFLSRHARGAGTLVNNSNQTVLSVVGTRVGINNSMPQSALDVAGSVRSTNIVGTGTAVVAGTITAKKFEGRGIVPIGGIIVWSGTKPPTGWALCDGQVANGRKTPDLRGRFVVGTGAGTGLTSREAGQVGGLEKVTLTAQQMPVHRHVVDVPALPTQSGGGHNHVFQSGAGSGEGLGKDDNQNHWLYSGAYITGHWTDGAGNHTHVVDIPNFRVVPVGGGQPANNLPPFYAMAFIMRVE